MVGVCRYRISPRLFKRIADAVTAYDDFFKQKRNSAGKKGCHPYQKCLAAIKMLATGCSADSLDREFRMSAALIMKSLTLFIRAVVHLFKDEYLRHPTAQEIQELLQEAEKRGFPGMIGSIDCMHWVWDKCPVPWYMMLAIPLTVSCFSCCCTCPGSWRDPLRWMRMAGGKSTGLPGRCAFCMHVCTWHCQHFQLYVYKDHVSFGHYMFGTE